MTTLRLSLYLFLLVNGLTRLQACSILFYKDSVSGKVYAANNEDYWYDVKPYIQLVPASKGQQARLWYGWDDFAQGGINQAGLFFDAANTPDQKPKTRYPKLKGNFGDSLLAYCKNVAEALNYLEQHKVALSNAHFLIGDREGHAVVVEWYEGMRNVIPMQGGSLLATNFLLSDTSKGAYPCPRYEAMQKGVAQLQGKAASLLDVGQVLARAVQLPNKDRHKRQGGTLYSTFIDITDMQFILVYKLDNAYKINLDLKGEFVKPTGRRIYLK